MTVGNILWSIVVILLAIWIAFTCYVLFRIGQILNNIKELISGISEVSDSLVEDVKQLVAALVKSIDGFNSGIASVRNAGERAGAFFKVASKRMGSPMAKIISFIVSYRYLLKKKNK